MSTILFDNVSVIYQQRREHMLLRDHLREIVKKKSREGFYALHEVSFRVEKGESLGVVGANGAGKSTLLAVLAGLCRPDRGSVKVNGQVGALLDLGSGFHPDLTGRENILINAALMGLTERQANSSSESIIEFAELAEFIDEPLRTYSSGMVLRLGFAVAIHAHIDVLLLDEILAVGDMAFQRKCIGRILGLRRAGKTLVCVSHVPTILEKLCDRLIWLHHGQLVQEGDFASIEEAYQDFMADRQRHLHDDIPHVPVAVGSQPLARASASKKKGGV